MLDLQGDGVLRLIFDSKGASIGIGQNRRVLGSTDFGHFGYEHQPILKETNGLTQTQILVLAGWLPQYFQEMSE